MSLTIQTHSPEETVRLGNRIGKNLAAGTVIALTGALGSGKTAFTQGVARGIGIADRYVASPSYTLVNHYPGNGLALYHVDLYRLSDRREAEDLGLDDVLHKEGVVAIEWAEKFGHHFWDEDLEIQFELIGVMTRKIRVISHGPIGDRIMSALSTDQQQRLSEEK